MVPDDARLRLQTLGAPPPVPRAAPAPEPPRPGWPSAPPGTPGARLAFASAPSDGTSPDDPDDDVGVPGTAVSRRPSPWDERPRGLARWLPASWAGARWDPGGWGAVGLAAVAALAAVVAAVGVWSGRPVAEPVPALPVVSAEAPAPALAGATPGPAPGGEIVVDVAGKVQRPGLVTLRDGQRVGDAVDAAGGPLPDVDLSTLNLAARVTDGQQILVGAPAPPAGSAPAADDPGGGPAAPAGDGKVDLNAATLEQLDALPGVGPVTAKKILDWRTQNGRFTAVEQLQEISGIGEARFATLRDVVRV